MARFLQGTYKPINPDKYAGNVKDIVYRSSWELAYMRRLDTDDKVLSWVSEEVVIPYRDHNGRIHRYFMDFKVTRCINEEIITELIEIKPYKETQPPVLTEGKKTKTKLREVLTWEKNQRKWAAARKFCEMKGWNFRIVTEKQLPVANGKKYGKYKAKKI